MCYLMTPFSELWYSNSLEINNFAKLHANGDSVEGRIRTGERRHMLRMRVCEGELELHFGCGIGCLKTSSENSSF